jgi:hypothetical protein
MVLFSKTEYQFAKPLDTKSCFLFSPSKIIEKCWPKNFKSNLKSTTESKIFTFTALTNFALSNLRFENASLS